MSTNQPSPATVESVVMRRLGFAAGEAGQLVMVSVLSGPIPFDDAPKPVRDLFDDPLRKVTRVVVVHRDLNTDIDPEDGFVWVWDRLDA